jgi:hypothetical protein
MTVATNSEWTQSLSDLIEGFWTTQLIGTAVAVGIPDRLAGGAMSYQEVAQSCDAEPTSVLRLLRALQTIGVCRGTARSQFGLTDKGRLLCTGVPGSMRGRALFAAGLLWKLFGDLESAVRTGRPSQRITLGREGFDRLANDPGLPGMHQAMVESSIKVISAADDAHFNRYARVLDVGGGYGGALTALLQRNPHMRGDVLDLGYLESQASEYLRQAGVAGRARFIAGDFFESVPHGYDCYLLKYIIHDWDDAHALSILRSCAAAAARSAEVVLLERVLPADLNETHRAIAQIDLAMMMTNGKERTEEEYRQLMASAGLRVLSVTPAAAGCSVIRATSAG